MKLLAKFQGPSHQGEIRGGPCEEGEKMKRKRTREQRKRNKESCTGVKSGACGEQVGGKWVASS